MLEVEGDCWVQSLEYHFVGYFNKPLSFTFNGLQLKILPSGTHIMESFGQTLYSTAIQPIIIPPLLDIPQTVYDDLSRKRKLHIAMQNIILKYEPVSAVGKDVENFVVVVGWGQPLEC